MKNFWAKSAAEQLADFIKQQIVCGVWQNFMPGAPAVARQLGVDHRMVISAFEILETEGLLVSEGVGKSRRILLSEDQSLPALKLQILAYEESDKQLFWSLDLQHRLMSAGHICAFSSVTVVGLGMDLSKLKRHFEMTTADAWIVYAGSEQILSWFALQNKPAFALAGRMKGTGLPGCRPDKATALRVAVRRLIELGHRRIVLMVREERRKPLPGTFERTFLQELEANGIQIGPYNLPDWDDNVQGFHRCLESLFRHTPPTAIVVDGFQNFIAAQIHLSQRGIIAPRDVSLISTDPNPAFNWCEPTVAHIDWNAEPMVRRMLRWADQVARGKEDRKQDHINARFVEGGTIGPAPRT